MLNFGQGQFEAMGGGAIRAFEDRMLVHLRKCFPDHTAALDEEQTRVLIRHGIVRAARFDLVTERNVCKYIDVMIALGPLFDEEPSRAWAVALLEDTAARPSPSDRINALYDAVLARLETAAAQGVVLGRG